jgi:hypothetical protein
MEITVVDVLFFRFRGGRESAHRHRLEKMRKFRKKGLLFMNEPV